MALTAKPISTISYNSLPFLVRKVTRMFNAHIIEDYRYIFHYGEDGDKDHVHLLLYPNKRLDTGLLRDEFKEIPDGGDPEKPLGCMPFRTSKTDHWLMYVIHDPEYLKNHKSDNDGDGKIPYQLNDIITPFPEQLDRDYKSAIKLRKTNNQEVLDRLIHGQMVTDIMAETSLNPSIINAIANAYRQENRDYDEHQNRVQKEAFQIARSLDNQFLRAMEELDKFGVTTAEITLPDGSKRLVTMGDVKEVKTSRDEPQNASQTIWDELPEKPVGE